MYLAGGKQPHAVTAAAGHSSWLASAAFPGPALLAAAAAVTVAAAPWLSRPWRRTAWIALGAAGAARLITGTVLPAELVLAFAAGVTVGAAVLVAFGVPDRRIGSEGIAAALRSAGLPVASVEPAGVQTKGSRPFVAVTDDGRRLFVKALGSDQRDADLLYRAYRFARLRNVGDTWPAASVIRAVEHQALIGVMAERAGVRVPRVDQVIKAGGGTALLVMDRVDGSSLGQLPAELISDDLLQRLWADVDRLHRAGIAHRSLRTANVMAGDDGRPWLTDFSFSELAATQRQQDLDLAELLASLAIVVGADRATASAAGVIGARAAGGRGAVAAAAGPVRRHPSRHRPRGRPARSNQVRRRRGQRGERAAAGAPAAGPAPYLADHRRLGRCLLLRLAPACGREQQLARPAIRALGLAAGHHRLLRRHLPGQRGRADRRRARPGTVLAHHLDPGRLVVRQPGLPRQRRRHGPERPVPAKSGVPPGAGVAAVGVNALMGAVAHLILLVIFFTLAGHQLGHAFKLPPASKLLLILAVVAALAGIVLATRRGRRLAKTRLLPGLRSAAVSLRTVAVSPVKLTLLAGGSALITLAYIGGLVASVQAFGGHAGIAEIGAVYLGAAVIAAASPTPGGLGAIEAALVAGLTGIGVPPGPAVSAVLTYRLATYWLPVIPGWAAWRLLQRQDYV